MTRQAPCGPADAARKARLARAYLDQAEQAATGASDEARTVAAGNAVLAAIAASDALTCLRLGRHSRGQDHAHAAAVLRTIRPDGARHARDLTTVLGVKDAAHYGSVFVSAAALKSTLRAAGRLVDAAETAISA
ncbi:MAG TPA: hypothetical protein VKX24_08825 [Acidimicrobiia bacterium]|nr:hypothetical protein [Acidimicrobiia bacterium]